MREPKGSLEFYYLFAYCAAKPIILLKASVISFLSVAFGNSAVIWTSCSRVPLLTPLIPDIPEEKAPADANAFKSIFWAKSRMTPTAERIFSVSSLFNTNSF